MLTYSTLANLTQYQDESMGPILLLDWILSVEQEDGRSQKVEIVKQEGENMGKRFPYVPEICLIARTE